MNEMMGVMNQLTVIKGTDRFKSLMSDYYGPKRTFSQMKDASTSCYDEQIVDDDAKSTFVREYKIAKRTISMQINNFTRMDSDGSFIKESIKEE